MFFKKKTKRESVENHIEKYLGKIHMVFHEIVSPDIHLDIYWIKTQMHGQNVNVLVTGGMSEREMNTPPDMKAFRYAELCIILPEDWKLTSEDFTDENNYWPVRMLKMLGRFPHDYNTWLCMEHTIENQDGKPYADSVRFTGALIFVAMSVNPKFHSMKFEGEAVNFLTVIPLYPEEIKLKLELGIDALFEKLEKYGVNDILDISRPNVAL